MKQQDLVESNVAITGDMVNRWVHEAEKAFEGNGNMWATGAGSVRPRTVEVSDSVWNLAARQAGRTGITMSEYVRRCLVRGLNAEQE